MKRLRILILVIAALSLTAAGPSRHDDERRLRADLTGLEEVPVVNTVASGKFRARISPDEQTIEYRLSYSGLQGTVSQAHIHIAQPSVTGSIVIWLVRPRQIRVQRRIRATRGPTTSPGRSRPTMS
jgi:hypothetical protein